jgi:hypothetical protein
MFGFPNFIADSFLFFMFYKMPSHIFGITRNNNRPVGRFCQQQKNKFFFCLFFKHASDKIVPIKTDDKYERRKVKNEIQ